MKMRTLFLGLALLFCLHFISVAEEGEDIVYLKAGGKIQGTIQSESPEKIIISTLYRTEHVVYREEIDKVVRAMGPEDQYKAWLQKLESNAGATGNEYYQLGLFCEKHKSLQPYSKELFQKAIQLDPNHVDARGKLGYILFEGKWTTLADLEKARRKVEEEEQERIRKWEAWKKEQEKLRELGKTKEREKPKEPEKDNPAKKGGVYDKYLGMFQYKDADVPWDQAHSYESKYYLIRSNTKKEFLKNYGKILDSFFEIFKKVFRYEGTPAHKSEIWIYANREEFLQKTGKDTALGFYSFQTRRVVTFHGRYSMETNTFKVLAHECTHQFQHLILGTGNCFRTPIWIIEGLAVFLSTADYDGKKMVIGSIPKDFLLPLQRLLRSGKYIRLKDLFTTPQSHFTGTHYAHAWAIIYWMVYTSSRNKQIFMQIWDKCKESGMTMQEFKEIIQVDLDKWEAVWKDWVLKLKA